MQGHHRRAGRRAARPDIMALRRSRSRPGRSTWYVQGLGSRHSDLASATCGHLHSAQPGRATLSKQQRCCGSNIHHCQTPWKLLHPTATLLASSVSPIISHLLASPDFQDLSYFFPLRPLGRLSAGLRLNLLPPCCNLSRPSSAIIAPAASDPVLMQLKEHFSALTVSPLLLNKADVIVFGPRMELGLN